jgi:hypothetical protein
MNLEFYAVMNWWSIVEMPTDDSLLPEEFLQAKKLWLQDAENNEEKIIELLNPFLRSLFILENIQNFKDLFGYEKEVEIPAKRVCITKINFDTGSLPTCSTEAFFYLKVKKNFNKVDLNDWQEKNSYFTDAVSFYWDLKINDFDSSFGSHSGVECVPIKY